MPLPHDSDQPRLALRAKIIVDIAANGPHCSLNHLDLTGVQNMDALFEDLGFNGDISEWDVSQVRTMQWIFKGTPFNGDISRWNTRNVQNMAAMFESTPFDGDISNWNVRNARSKARMFMNCPFNGDLSKWDMSRTWQTFLMFAHSAFNQPIGLWNMECADHTTEMFSGSIFNQDISAWKLRKGTHNNMFLNSRYQGGMPTMDLTNQSPGDQVLDPRYRGDFQNKYTIAQARALFGTLKNVDTYLQARLDAGHPMDRLHIEKVIDSKRKPEWASKEMKKWLCAEQSVHEGLNLSKDESMALLNRAYREQFMGQEKPTLERLSFDFISTV